MTAKRRDDFGKGKEESMFKVPLRESNRRSGEERVVDKLTGAIERILTKSPRVNQRRMFTHLVRVVLMQLEPEDQRQLYISMLWPGHPVCVGDIGPEALDQAVERLVQGEFDFDSES
jgi:hypothetical protein